MFALSRRFARSGNVASPVDFGVLVSTTGLGPGWRVVEAGTGSGFLTAFLSRAVGPSGRVVSYEVREEAVRIARSNLALAGAGNVELVEGPLPAALPPASFELACLDLRDAAEALPSMAGALVPGGWVFVYSPFIEQVAAVHRAAAAIPLAGLVTYEPLMREVEVDTRGSRGSSRLLGQSRYLTFARKA